MDDSVRLKAVREAASEPRERSAPAQGRARERAGESEGRSPSVSASERASEPRERSAPAQGRARERAGESEGRSPSVRLDIWLDVACLFKTRSEAQTACRTGKIEVNGQPAKPNRLVRAGDRLTIGRAFGRKQLLEVRGIADRHVAKAEARQLYEDLTPAPTPEEIEQRKMERMYRAAVTPPRAPDKRDRRALRKIKERGGR